MSREQNQLARTIKGKVQRGIRFPSPLEEAAELQEFIAAQQVLKTERQEAINQAEPALARLMEVLKDRSGQPYKLRALLYSMWNGKPVSLTETLGFDWQIKKDFVAVLLAFGGWNDKQEFFYNAIERAVRAAGQWEWFLEEAKEFEKLAEWVESLRRQV